jgi:MFS family permease
LTDGEHGNRQRGRGARTFLAVWTAQLLSLLATAMTVFAVGVWTFERTGSVTRYSLVLFFGVLPTLLLTPIAGALVDRWDRRTALLLGAAGGGASSLAMALLLLAGRLEAWHVYLLVAAGSATQALRWPALSASVVLLVPRSEATRANGLLQLGMALSQMLAPVTAGALLAPIGLAGVLLLATATAALSAAALLLVRIPRPAAPAGEAGRGTLLGEFVEGWRYLTARPGLLSLLALFAVVNFLVGLVTVLATPLVLGFADARVLGVVLSVASAGLLAGGLLTTVWRGPRRRLDGILVPMLAQGPLLVVAGLRPNAVLVAACACAYLFAFPLVAANSQAIWQEKVAPELQGRVFALRQMVALSAVPLSRLVAGPLADGVFEPLLAPGGALAGSLGRVLGVGPGRGIGLLFVVLGVASVVAVAAGWSSPRLRRVEIDIPSATPAGAAAPAGAPALSRSEVSHA